MEHANERGDKFDQADIIELRNELLMLGDDYHAMAGLLQLFATGRGYSISGETASDIAARVNVLTVEDFKARFENATLEN